MAKAQNKDSRMIAMCVYMLGRGARGSRKLEGDGSCDSCGPVDKLDKNKCEKLTKKITLIMGLK